MRIAVTGGGTGGHVYPALAVIAELLGSEEVEETDLLYIGTESGLESPIVSRRNIPFTAIKAGAIRGNSLVRLIKNIGSMTLGLAQSMAILRKFKPNVILATGGYVCAPVVFAGWFLRIPILIYLPDVEPGWAIKFLARFAQCIAVTSRKSNLYLPLEKVRETGYPVRAEFFYIDKAQAQSRLGLDPDLKTILIWGGSRGAHSINLAISKQLPQLLSLCQVIHLSGTEDEPWLRELSLGLPEEQQRRYFLFSYIDEELPYAMAAAELAVSRAGASVMGEFPAIGLPSILVPYPYAGAHQRKNAEFMAEMGASILLDDVDLDEMHRPIEELLSDEGRLASMSANARHLARPEAARTIVSLLHSISKVE